MPFHFPDPIQVLIEYYLEGKTRFELNMELLENHSTYTQALVNTFNNNPEKVYFGVLRHSEKELPGTHSKKEYFGSVKALEKRIIYELKQKGFEWDYYGLEFRGTPHQTVSKRYLKSGQVYSICTKQGQPPIIVSKRLGERADNWQTSKDSNQESPASRKGIYSSVDDTTRKQAWTRIIVPGKDSRLFVPQILKKEYETYDS